MSWLNEMKDTMKENMEELKGAVKDWITNQYNTKVTIQECAFRILRHPSTQQKRAEYLGLLFNYYTLQEQGFTYKLETKGEQDEQILELKIIENGQVIYGYYYYQADASLSQTIHLPKERS